MKKYSLLLLILIPCAVHAVKEPASLSIFFRVLDRQNPDHEGQFLTLVVPEKSTVQYVMALFRVKAQALIAGRMFSATLMGGSMDRISLAQFRQGGDGNPWLRIGDVTYQSPTILIVLD